MSAFSAGIVSDLKERFAPRMENLAVTMRDEMREIISIQVVGRGRKAIRSKPGEPPRREFGNLQDSQQYDVTIGDDYITASLFTDSKIGGYLENGTSRIAPRPHYAPYSQLINSKIDDLLSP